MVKKLKIKLLRLIWQEQKIVIEIKVEEEEVKVMDVLIVANKAIFQESVHKVN